MILRETSAIIQARMNSSRFPSKIKKNLGGKTLLEFCIKGVKLANLVDKIIIATTNNHSDDWIENHFGNQKDIFVFRGKENDVLSRFRQAAEKYNVEVIVRITADDPFKPPWLINKLIKKVREENFDYASNTIKPSYPEGLDVEVFSIQALTRASENASLNSEREHVTPFIWKNTDKFNCYSDVLKDDLSWARLTIDYEDDLQRMKKIWLRYGENMYKKDILKRFLEDKYLEELSKSSKNRNEGYYSSLKQENN